MARSKIADKNKKDTLCLDGLKGVGAFIIAFMWHYQHFTSTTEVPLSRYFPLSFNYGYLMVEIFFMLSGFGMMLGYCDKILKHKIGFKDYIFKRIKKIYPLFFLTLIITTIFEYIYLRLNGSTFIYPNFDLYHFVLNVLCIQDGIFDINWSFNSPSWCISVCMILYCLLYYVVYKSKDKKEVFYKFIFILCLTQVLTDAKIVNLLLSRGIRCFCIGVILAYIYSIKDKFNYKLVGRILLLFVIFSFIIIRLYGTKYSGDLSLFMKFGFAPALILAMLFNNILGFIFKLKPLVFLGSISIEIYLFHFPTQLIIEVIDKIFKLKINYFSTYIWILYILITISIAYLYHRYINNRFTTKLIDMFKPKKVKEK